MKFFFYFGDRECDIIELFDLIKKTNMIVKEINN